MSSVFSSFRPKRRRYFGAEADPSEREYSSEYKTWVEQRMQPWMRAGSSERGEKPVFTGRRYVDSPPPIPSSMAPASGGVPAALPAVMELATAQVTAPPEAPVQRGGRRSPKAKRLTPEAEAEQVATKWREWRAGIDRQNEALRRENTELLSRSRVTYPALPEPTPAMSPEQAAQREARVLLFDMKEARAEIERNRALYNVLAAEAAKLGIPVEAAPAAQASGPGPERIVERIVHVPSPGGGPNGRARLQAEIERLIPLAEDRRQRGRENEYDYLRNKINVLMATLADPDAVSLDGVRRRGAALRGSALNYARDAAMFLKKGDCRLAAHHMEDAIEAAGPRPKRTLRAKLSRLNKKIHKKCRIR